MINTLSTYRPQTADRRLQKSEIRDQKTADCRLQTADRRPQTADWRLQTAEWIECTSDRSTRCWLRTAGRKSQRPQRLIGHKLWLFGHVKDVTGMSGKCNSPVYSKMTREGILLRYNYEANSSIFFTRQKRKWTWQIEISFLCVCPVIDHEFRHNIVQVAVYPRSQVDPQTILTMLWQTSMWITGRTH